MQGPDLIRYHCKLLTNLSAAVLGTVLIVAPLGALTDLSRHEND